MSYLSLEISDVLFSDTANSEQRRVMRRRRPSDAADVTMSANSRVFSLLPRGSDLAGELLLLPRGSDFARELCERIIVRGRLCVDSTLSLAAT